MFSRRCAALSIFLTALTVAPAFAQPRPPLLSQPLPFPQPNGDDRRDPFVEKMEENVKRLSAMSEHETKAYLRAVAFFESYLPHESRTVMLGFLKSYPKSRKAPDILYRLAMLGFIENNEAEAMHYLEQLLFEHYSSTWAGLALKSHFREDTFFKMATNIRDKALASKSNEHDLAATELLSQALERYKGNPERLKEVTYKLYDYLLRRHTEYPGAREALAKLAESKDDDSRWVKLARIRLADASKFLSLLDALSKMEGTDGEVSRLIVELAEQHRDKLEGDDAMRVRFLRAEALIGLGRREDGLKELHALAKDGSKSSWTGEAIFWLAENAYADAQAKPVGGILRVHAVESPEPLRQAQALYRRLAKEHSTHPRALKAAEWANHIDRQDDVRRELENVLLRSYAALQNKFSLSAKLTSKRDGSRGTADGCEIMLAWRDRQHYRLDMVYAKTGVSLVTNPQGTWFWDRTGPIRRAKEALDLPMPVLWIQADENKFLMGLGVDPSLKSPGLRVNAPPDAARQLAQRIAETCHISSTAYVHKDKKQRRIVLENADPRSPVPTRIEIMVDAAGVVETLRMISRDPEGTVWTITLDPLVIGGDVPESLFNAIEPMGTPIVEVDQINPYILAGQFVQIYTEIGQAAKALHGK